MAALKSDPVVRAHMARGLAICEIVLLYFHISWIDT